MTEPTGSHAVRSDLVPEPVRALLRAASWHRRLLAAGCAAAAMAFALDALAAPPAPTVRVVAAARDIAAGATLGTDDVRVVGLPSALVPVGALRVGSDVVGRVAAAPLRRGEPITDVRLVGSELAAALPDGQVATPVRVADPGVTGLLRPGDVVDVLAASGEELDAGAGAVVVASAVRVVTVPARSEDHAGIGDGALIVLATTPQVATALAQAAVTARLSVTVRGG